MTDVQIALTDEAGLQWNRFSDTEREALDERFGPFLNAAYIALDLPNPNFDGVTHEAVTYLRRTLGLPHSWDTGTPFVYSLGPDFRGWFIAEHYSDIYRFTIKTFERTITLGAAVETTAALEASGGVSHGRRSPARRTTAWAARLAGTERSHLDREWAAVLMGSPEDGITHSARRQMVLAVGFILAATRMRAHDLARPAWRPVDWILRVESRTNSFITAVVGAQAIYIVDDGGLTALVTEVWEPCGGAAVALYALSKWLRRVRGIELAETRREGDDA